MLRGLKSVELGVGVRPEVLVRLMLSRSSVSYAVEISALVSGESKARPRAGGVADGLAGLGVLFGCSTFRFLVLIYLTSSVGTGISARVVC
jgi:hypothetical protein